MKRRGIFISFEGSEGCGKSTQIQILAETLERKNIPFVLVREPGGTAIGEKIRHLLKHTAAPLCPQAELFLFAASRAQLVREILSPTLTRGASVICDRFFDSTVVYQGIARNLPAGLIEYVNKYAIEDCIPDITFLLDMDIVPALERAALRRTAQEPNDRMEEEPTEFYEKVRQGYLERARKEPERFVILDAKETTNSLSQIIIRTLEQRWPFQLKTPYGA